MSRSLQVLPPGPIQRRELETIELVRSLREKGFTEGAYEKPDRVFTKEDHVVRINIREGIVTHSGKVFRGSRYPESIPHIQNLSV